MRITRLLLGAVVAPLAFVTPGFAADVAASQPAAQGEVAATSAKMTEPAATPATQPAPHAKHAVALGPEGTDDQGRTGRIHTVVRGDTLWDISEAYLGSPWVWPSIWKANPKVANPNRIYPGNRLWIAPGEMRQLSDAEAAAIHPVAQAPAAISDASPQPTRMQEMPNMEQIGFVTAEELETAGSLIGSPEEEKWLSANRRAYVSFGEGQVKVGDRFSIVREHERVRDPATNKVLGVHIDKLGWLEITRVDTEASEALIRDSYGEILRGDRLIPRVEPAREIAVHPSATPVEGQVALNPEDRTLMGHYDLVFLNRGSDSGLEIGTPLEIFRPSGIAKDPKTDTDYKLPDEVVANLVVVAVRPESAVAYVTHASRELGRGELFRNASDEKSSFREVSSMPLEATEFMEHTIRQSDAKQSPAAPASMPPAHHMSSGKH